MNYALRIMNAPDDQPPEWCRQGVNKIICPVIQILQDESAQSKRKDHAQADDRNVQYIHSIPVSLT